jgi:high affinity Mn2+ porin
MPPDRRPHRSLWSGALILALFACRALDAQEAAPNTTHTDHGIWNLHFQSTLIGQGDLPFPAKYSGANSLEPHGEVKDTFSLDVTGGVRLWRGGKFFTDVLMWQGYGLSNTTGVAAFPNGEAFRVGKTYPDAIIARAYLRQTFSLGGAGDSGADPMKPSTASGAAPQLTFWVGRFAPTDIFDRNAYAGDARTQFMNWALITNAAWDYPANTTGVTNGAAMEFDWRSWAARWGIFQVSRIQNGITLDWNLPHAWSFAGELERRYSLGGRSGAVRLLAYEERAHMGNYQQSLPDPADIQLNGRLRYRSKYGFGINLQQEIRKDLGAFARLGWNDGKNEIWEFTDVDRTASAGLSLKGQAWRRPGDTVGLGAVVNGISAAHRQFLAAGGLGITVGDGALDYRSERLGEAYYDWKAARHLWLTLDYQLAINPAYNHVRGPANIFATRLHWAF